MGARKKLVLAAVAVAAVLGGASRVLADDCHHHGHYSFHLHVGGPAYVYESPWGWGGIYSYHYYSHYDVVPGPVIIHHHHHRHWPRYRRHVTVYGPYFGVDIGVGHHHSHYNVLFPYGGVIIGH